MGSSVPSNEPAPIQVENEPNVIIPPPSDVVANKNKEKYLKYKLKYLALKKKLSQNNDQE